MSVAVATGISSVHLWGVWMGGIIALFVVIALSVALASFLLSPLFQTNALLERLVKETLHELNAPLATIKANAQLLHREHADEKSRKRLSRIQQASTNLYALYEQMEYYIKREIRLVKEDVFDAREAVEVCVEKSSGLQGSITLTCTCKPTLVETDRIGFEQSVMNLLSNAYKHNTPSGWVDVQLSAGKLTVKDGGSGMDEQTQFRVFDRYYQENPTTSGYGMGLSMVKEYCDTYGIFISLVSKIGQGTNVTLHLGPILKKAE
jgi:signal transduction histidine kinase